MIESSKKNSTTILSPEAKNTQNEYESGLRPQTLSEYIGQEKIKENLKILISSAQKRQEAIEHILLYGGPGLGKTTLAQIIAHELNVQIRVTSGPAIEKTGDLASILTNLKENDILFIDEIHRLKTVVEEMLYSAMEDFSLDIIIGKGPAARSMRLTLPRFTLIGATTKVSKLSSPLRDRFGSIFHLKFYSHTHISEIIRRSARLLELEIDDPAAEELAKCSRQTPRIANRLLKRTRDFACIRNLSRIDKKMALETLEALGIDNKGLDETDKQLLNLIIKKFNGGPVGLTTLAAATGEEKETIEDLYEPFLIKLGFLDRTPRGRRATNLAYDYFGLPQPAPIEHISF